MPTRNKTVSFTDDSTSIPLYDENRYENLSSNPVPQEQEFQILPTRADKVIARRDLDAPSDDGSNTQCARTLSDYMLIRLPGRGKDGDTMVFKWTINPSSIQVNYQSIDSRAMVRSGWVFGLWGDDCVEISMSGQSAGYYYSNGLTDTLKEFSLSYRNLLMLQNIVENNGFWFEGEDSCGTGPLAASSARKRIKYHEDVQLVYNNFIWYGMFQSISIESDAGVPFFDRFSLSFVAWKERFRKSSPYLDSIHNNLQRGHVRNAWKRYGTHQNSGTDQPVPPMSQADLVQSVPGGNPFMNSPNMSIGDVGNFGQLPNYNVGSLISAPPVQDPNSIPANSIFAKH